MHAYWCQLVHSVTLIAQPRSKTPFAKVGAMKSGKYEPKNSGTFGVMWFTDFGDKFWEACRGVDDTPKLRLRDSGFDEMDWSVSFRFAGFKARITSVKYKGFFGKPGNSYMELKIGTQNPNDLRVFLQAFVEKFETPPWIMNNWKKAEAKCGFSKEEIISEWSKGMGREITEEETKVKGWGASLFGSKSDKEEQEYEVFEDADGNDVLHKGISQRMFSKVFTVADDVEVKGAELKDGLLKVSMERIIPEAKKAKTIEIK